MGKKIEIKKIGNKKIRLVTYSKRKQSLIKKAKEISVACGVDIAVVTFSPAKRSRSSSYCNQERIEDVIQRYLDLSLEKRFHEVNNYKRRVHCTCHTEEKLKQLDHIKGDHFTKLYYVDNQIRDLELRIKNSSVDLDNLNKRLRVYEAESEEDVLPSQLVWLERNLKNSLQQVRKRKKELIGTPARKYRKFSRESEGTDHQLSQEKQNPNSISLSMQHDPSMASNRFPKGSFQELLAQGSGTSAGNSTQNLSISAASFPSQEITQFPLNLSDSDIQGLDSPAHGIQNYPIPQTSEENWNNQNLILPPTSYNFQANPNEMMINSIAQNSDFNSERVLSPLDREPFDLTDVDIESIIAAVNDSGRSTVNPTAAIVDHHDGYNDDNGNNDAAPSEVHPLPNSNENEKGDGARSNNIEGNKDENGSWELDGLKWAEELSLEDLAVLLDEL